MVLGIAGTVVGLDFFSAGVDFAACGSDLDDSVCLDIRGNLNWIFGRLGTNQTKSSNPANEMAEYVSCLITSSKPKCTPGENIPA